MCNITLELLNVEIYIENIEIYRNYPKSSSLETYVNGLVPYGRNPRPVVIYLIDSHVKLNCNVIFILFCNFQKCVTNVALAIPFLLFFINRNIPIVIVGIVGFVSIFL